MQEREWKTREERKEAERKVWGSLKDRDLRRDRNLLLSGRVDPILRTIKHPRIWMVRYDDRADGFAYEGVWVKSANRDGVTILQLDFSIFDPDEDDNRDRWYHQRAINRRLLTWAVGVLMYDLDDVETFQCNVMSVRRRNRRKVLDLVEEYLF